MKYSTKVQVPKLPKMIPKFSTWVYVVCYFEPMCFCTSKPEVITLEEMSLHRIWHDKNRVVLDWMSGTVLANFVAKYWQKEKYKLTHLINSYVSLFQSIVRGSNFLREPWRCLEMQVSHLAWVEWLRSQPGEMGLK